MSVVEPFHLSRPANLREEFWAEVYNCYQTGQFTDLEITCQGSNMVISCHQLVLTSISKTFGDILKTHRGDDLAKVVLPDHQFHEVKAFVDNVYNFLIRGSSLGEEWAVNQSMQDLFDVRQAGNFLVSKPLVDDFPSFSAIVPSEPFDELESQFDDLESLSNSLLLPIIPTKVNVEEENDAEEKFSLKETKKKRRGRKRKMSEGLDDPLLIVPSLKVKKPEKARTRKSVPLHNLTATDDVEVEKEKLPIIPTKVNVEKENDTEEKFSLKETKKKRRGRKRKMSEGLDDPLLVVPSLKVKKPEKAQTRKSVPLHNLTTTENVEEEKEKLRTLMSEGNSTLEVILLKEPLDVNVHFNKHHLQATKFQALVGLVSSSTSRNLFHIKPLAWSFPSTEDITSQFENVFSAFRALYGYSDADICYTNYMYARQGLYTKCKATKVKYDLKLRLAKLNDRELRELLMKPEVVEATRRYPIKQASSSWEPGVGAQFILDGQRMTFDDLEGVALLSWKKDRIEGRLLQVSESDREKENKNLMRALFEVWCIGRQQRIPQSDHLCQRFDKLIMAMETFNIVHEFITKDANKVQRKEILQKERQCPECGKVFKWVTTNQHCLFLVHMRKHKYEKFECDCVPQPKNYHAKVKHIKLVHSDGKFGQCELCSFVGTPAALGRHACDSIKKAIKKREHNFSEVGGFVCCEEQFPDIETITDHVTRFHTEDKYIRSCIRCDRCNYLGSVNGVRRHKLLVHAKQEENGSFSICETCGKSCADDKALTHHKKIHKIYYCDNCSLEIVGWSAHQTHLKNVHNKVDNQRYTCEVCKKEFEKKINLKLHFIRKHMKSEECPFQCECGRGFARKFELDSHKMMAHIKARPFRCRYDCGADYNDSASRGTHELKKHGARFPNEKRTKKNTSV